MPFTGKVIGLRPGRGRCLCEVHEWDEVWLEYRAGTSSGFWYIVERA